MRTIILAFVIALTGLVMIAAGALDLFTLQAEEGEMLQVNDYLGLAEALRLLLRIAA